MSWLAQTVGWLLGLDGVKQIDDIQVSAGAGWAQGAEAPFWIFLAAVLLVVIAVVFYVRFQDKGPLGLRIGLAISRALVLLLLLATLADPILRVTRTTPLPPLVYVLFDGSESMAIEDELPDAERAAIEKAVDWSSGSAPAAAPTTAPPVGGGNAAEAAPGPAAAAPRTGQPSRLDYVRAFVARPETNALRELVESKKYRVECYIFEGANTSQLRRLPMTRDGREGIDPAYLAEQLKATGQVTAIGGVFQDLARQFRGGNLAAVILFSDFAQNSGVAPVGRAGGNDESPARRIKAPIFTVGVGARQAIDLAVRIQPPPKMKKAERAVIDVKLSQSGLDGQTVKVKLFARRLEGSAEGEAGATELVEEKTVTLQGDLPYLPFDYTPKDAGRFEFVAEVEPLVGETVTENNRSAREVNVIDDFLRLMYVAYEPNWEWRFIKEVFHRDKLVGMRGFRTFLRSSDPKVRQSNALFLPALTPKRSDFFANDVIFLGDMKGVDLNPRFCEMTREFVSRFGGSLVVIAGPRFGPGELANTALHDMLPVVVDPNARLRDQREFELNIGPLAAEYSFMQLGDARDRAEIEREWRRILGPIPWYQPVKRLRVEATALASHPTDTCEDGKTPQPIVAVKRFGAGEVVYIGMDETWRLRRKYGEKYYRQFWSQLIYRLGMSHALGSQKRFVVRVDRQQYQTDEQAILSVEAYDANYEPLKEDRIPDGVLKAELVVKSDDNAAPTTRAIEIPQLREGEFEARIPLFAQGEYSIRVRDPIAEPAEFSEVRFQVNSLSAERRSAVRSVDLQEQLAHETRGKSFDLSEANQLAAAVDLPMLEERQTRNKPLWSTPLWFGLLIGLLLVEWFARKQVSMV